MNAENQELKTLQDIRNIMERSSRFISLSGWSGVAAGICALIGAWFAYHTINNETEYALSSRKNTLLLIAVLTFISAFISAFFFTFIKSKKNQIPVWGKTARRLIWSVAVPMVSGGFFLLKIIQLDIPGLIAPGCLIFYGIALFSGSKQTLDTIKYLGYAEIGLGLICLCFTGYGIWFWAAGFGIFHIIYGIYMWWKYERE